MATHSSVLAWKIPQTEEPGELQSMGSQKSHMTEHTCAHTHSILGNAAQRQSFLEFVSNMFLPGMVCVIVSLM